jgi:hypothetical protein
MLAKAYRAKYDIKNMEKFLKLAYQKAAQSSTRERAYITAVYHQYITKNYQLAKNTLQHS